MSHYFYFITWNSQIVFISCKWFIWANDWTKETSLIVLNYIKGDFHGSYYIENWHTRPKYSSNSYLLFNEGSVAVRLSCYFSRYNRNFVGNSVDMKNWTREYSFIALWSRKGFPRGPHYRENFKRNFMELIWDKHMNTNVAVRLSNYFCTLLLTILSNPKYLYYNLNLYFCISI